MSGTGIDSVTAKHYGSEYTMVDYKTKVHNIYLAGSFYATDKLHFAGSVAYNISKAKYDVVNMVPPEDALANLTHQDFTFPEMDQYSELDFDYIQLTFGLEYLLPNGVSWSADVDYADLTDNTPYVYGDESGSMLILRTGFKFEF